MDKEVGGTHWSDEVNVHTDTQSVKKDYTVY